MAICGGVNNLLLPDVFVHLSKANMISPTGLCHTFSDKADGYTRSEGCGVVFLKRLKDVREKLTYFEPNNKSKYIIKQRSSKTVFRISVQGDI